MASSNVDENACEPCGVQGNPIRADGWCATCKEKLCQNCVNHHKVQKLSVHHEVIPITDATTEDQLFTDLEINENCYKHNEIIKMVCRDHSEPCCMVCIVSGHQHCKDMVPVDEFPERDITELAEEEISHLILDVDTRINKDKDYTTKMSRDEQAILLGASKFTKEFRSRFDALDNNFKKQVQRLFANDKNMRESRIQRFELLKKRLNSKYSTSDDRLVNLSPRQKVIFDIKLSSETNEAKKIIEQLAAEDAYVPLRFQANPSLGQIMATTVLGELVEDGQSASTIANAAVRFSKLELKLSTSANTTASAQVEAASKLNLMMSGVRLIMKITRDNLKLGNVFLFDGAFLSDGRLVMSD